MIFNLFSSHRPLSDIPCASVAECNPIFPFRNMRVIFTENRDKQARIVNGQEATIISAQNHTIIFRLPKGQRVFVYPVDDVPLTYYPFIPSYAQTITKSQGQNIKHLVLWVDSPISLLVRGTYGSLEFAARRPYPYFNPSTPINFFPFNCEMILHSRHPSSSSPLSLLSSFIILLSQQ